MSGCTFALNTIVMSSADGNQCNFGFRQQLTSRVSLIAAEASGILRYSACLKRVHSHNDPT